MKILIGIIIIVILLFYAIANSGCSDDSVTNNQSSNKNLLYELPSYKVQTNDSGEVNLVTPVFNYMDTADNYNFIQFNFTGSTNIDSSLGLFYSGVSFSKAGQQVYNYLTYSSIEFNKDWSFTLYPKQGTFYMLFLQLKIFFGYNRLNKFIEASNIKIYGVN